MAGTAKSSFLGQAPNFAGTNRLISSATASNSAEIEFTIPSATYKGFCFAFYNVQPVTDDVNLTFDIKLAQGDYSNSKQINNYSESVHTEDDVTAAVSLNSSFRRYSTSASILAGKLGNGSDESASGKIYMYSLNKYIEHNYMATTNFYSSDDKQNLAMFGGTCYHSTPSVLYEPVVAVKFLMSSGNINSGKFKMWGFR